MLFVYPSLCNFKQIESEESGQDCEDPWVQCTLMELHCLDIVFPLDCLKLGKQNVCTDKAHEG